MYAIWIKMASPGAVWCKSPIERCSDYQFSRRRALMVLVTAGAVANTIGASATGKPVGSAAILPASRDTARASG
jgi:hypothetical protein